MESEPAISLSFLALAALACVPPPCPFGGGKGYGWADGGYVADEMILVEHLIYTAIDGRSYAEASWSSSIYSPHPTTPRFHARAQSGA